MITISRLERSLTPWEWGLKRLKIFSKFFEHIAAAYVQRTAISSAKSSFFVKRLLRSHGVADSLHLSLASPASDATALRPTAGRELWPLLETTTEELYVACPPNSGLALSCLTSVVLNRVEALVSIHTIAFFYSRSERIWVKFDFEVYDLFVIQAFKI